MIADITGAGRKAGLFGSRMCDAGSGSAILVLAHVSALDRLREIVHEHTNGRDAGGMVLAEIGQGGVLSGWWEGVLDAAEEHAEAGKETAK